MNRLILTTRMAIGILMLLGGAAAANAQEANLKEAGRSPERKQISYKPNYLYLSGEVFSPMIFDDLYSWTREKFQWGKGAALKLGYQISPLWGVEISAAYGRNKAFPNAYQKNYVLGMDDAYTYYPYTEIDGTVYTYPVTDLFGEQGKHNLKDVTMSGVGFDKISSSVQYAQVSANAVINLTRIFSIKALYKEQPVEFILRPGVYLSRFDSKVELTADATNLQTKEIVKKGSRVAPKVNKHFTYGLGGDASIRFNLSQRWSLDLTSKLVWELDKTLDGIRSAKRAHDNFVWAPAVGVTYKFRTQEEPQHLTPQSKTPLSPEQQLALLPELFYAIPQAPQAAQPKQRKHSAKIYLTYPLNKTYILRELHQNPQELGKLDTEITSFLTNKDYTVTAVKIEGFASPEGPYDNNMRLAWGRAHSLIDYIVERTNLPYGMFTLGRMTENWEGLKAQLQDNQEIPQREQLLEVYNANQNTEMRKQQLTQTKGYKWLLENIYPTLRLSSYEITYAVKAYPLQEAKEVIKTTPQNLSPEEIYAVALDYGTDTPQGMKTIEVLKKIYPNEDLTRALQAFALIQEERHEQAVALLEQVKAPQNDLKNLLAVAYAKSGQFQKAQDLFRQASVTNHDARRNAVAMGRFLKQQP